MSYRDAKSGEVGLPTRDNYLPCRKCHGSTPKPMLMQYGAMCHSCFEAYCQEGFEPVRGSLSHKDKVNLLKSMRGLVGPKKPSRDWAIKLRDREQAGGLTPAQKAAWRSALGFRGTAGPVTFDAETGEEVA